MSIKQIQYVIALYRFRHFGQAAEHCNVTQSTLSSQLVKLEQFLGTRLFERNSRKVIPTDNVVRLLPMMENIITSYEQILATVDAQPPAELAEESILEYSESRR